MITILVIYLPTLIATLVLAALLITGTSVGGPRRQFGIFTAFISAWTLLTMLTDITNNKSLKEITLQLAIASGTCATFWLVVFARSFIESRNKYVLALAGFPASIFLVFGFSHYMISGVHAELGAQPINIGPLYQAQSLYTLLVFLGSITWLFWKTKHNPKKHNQVRWILAGLFIALSVNFIANYMLVLFDQGEKSGILGPPSFLILILFAYFALTRYRVFDIGSHIMRATSHLVITIIVASSLAFAGIFAIENLDKNVRLILGVAIIAVALQTFPTIMYYLNSIMRKYLYRKQYDSAEALNQLTNILVIEQNKEELINGVTTSLANILNVSCAQILNKSEIHNVRILQSLDSKNIIFYATDENPENGVEYAVKLLNKANTRWLLLTGKKSGALLSRQDRNLLEVFSKNLSVAIEHRDYTERIARFNLTLKEEIRSATESLRNSNDRLKELDKQKDELMSMASHQIRPQLTATRGFLDLLRDEGSKKERNELISLSTSSVERMIGVVTDMLNLSRYSGGKFEIIKTKTDLAAMLNREVITQNSFAESSGFNIRLNKKPAKAWVMADEAKLREVIANLIHNAVQYGSKEKPIVDINLSTSNGAIELTVRDYGIGVPKDQQDQMFKKFFRATNAKEKRPAGSGVGLFLAKKVIDGHEGKLIFESEEGKGSTFGFSLPILEK